VQTTLEGIEDVVSISIHDGKWMLYKNGMVKKTGIHGYASEVKCKNVKFGENMKEIIPEVTPPKEIKPKSKGLDIGVWHLRFNHASVDSILSMEKLKMVNGLDISQNKTSP